MSSFLICKAISNLSVGEPSIYRPLKLPRWYLYSVHAGIINITVIVIISIIICIIIIIIVIFIVIMFIGYACRVSELPSRTIALIKPNFLNH